MAEKLDILAISGSLRKGSHNTALLHAVKEMAPESMAIEIVTLHGIPLYDGDVEAESGIPEVVRELQERVRKADGVIICTPEYNFSMPGVLKNGTDWLSRGKHQPFRHKRVGIMGASPSPLGTGRSQYHLRQNLVGLEAVAMPKPEIFVSHAGEKFDKDGRLTDEGTRKVIALWLEAFEKWVRREV